MVALAQLDAVTHAGSGRGREIVEHVACIDGSFLDGLNHPCPKCGGKDRFRLLNSERGAVFCNQCFNKANGDFIAAVQWMHGVGFSEALRLCAEFLGIGAGVDTTRETRRITATYDYRSAEGKLLFQVVRMDPKDFRQRQPDGTGGWIWSVRGVELVPYALPQVLALPPGSTVFICEGEKDCDNLTAMGLTATTNPGGAGKWRADFAKWFADRGLNFVALPDNDDPGRKHAADVARKLSKVAASIKVVTLEGLPEKGDVSDWINRGGTEEQLRAIVEATAEWSEPEAAVEAVRAKPIPNSTLPDFLLPDGRTESAQARRFDEQFGNDVRYCATRKKWFIWDGSRWEIDNRNAVEAMAKRVADGLWDKVNCELSRVDRQTCTTLTNYCRAMSSARGVGSVLMLARSEPRIAILPSALDSHSWYFNCKNGTVDLRTGDLLPHERGHYLTKLCPHPYLQGAEGECPIWEETLEKIFAGNAELTGFFQRLCGMALVGEVIEQLLAILWGKGSNGKSLVIETLKDAIGDDYACIAPAELLLAAKGDRHPTEKVVLYGKRLVFASETDDGRRLAEATVKSLTGGDTVVARGMREDYWEYKPSHTLFLSTNYRPVVRGTDHGIWRRLMLVPFSTCFWDEDRGESGPLELKADKSLKSRLRPEFPGIVRWLVDGCKLWQRDGLKMPGEVTAATESYREGMDVLARFIDECCVVRSGIRTRAADLRSRYERWCRENGEPVVSGRRLGDYLIQRGAERSKSNGIIWYSGIGVASESSR